MGEASSEAAGLCLYFLGFSKVTPRCLLSGNGRCLHLRMNLFLFHQAAELCMRLDGLEVGEAAMASKGGSLDAF